MSKLKDFINEFQDKKNYGEEGRGKPISKERAIGLIEKNCSKYLAQMYNNGVVITRSTFSKKSEFVYMDTKYDETRMSRNTENYYTLILNNDPSWSGYPKRNVIAATKKIERAKGGMYFYVLFPYNNTKIGVCSDVDIWYSFPKIGSILSRNKTIHQLLSFDIDDPDKDFKTFKETCKKFDEMYKDEINNNPAQYVSWLNYDGDMYKAIVKLFNPKDNKFKLVKAGDRIPPEREVWFDSKCIWMVADEFQKYYWGKKDNE